MIEFDTDLADLRASSTALEDAAHAAYTAATAIRGLDVPTGPAMAGFGHLTTADNAFGRTLGMPSVASAYDAHLAAVTDLVGRLFQSALDTSRALRSIADVYQRSEDHGQARIQRAGGSA